MNRATRVTVATFGAVAGLAGIEHGIGEILQGNRAPGGLTILSWPDSRMFAILSGEPAMTIVPNLLVTGLLAIIVSLVFLGWAMLFVQRIHGGLVLILLSIVLLLVGGGFGPPLVGLILGLAAAVSNAAPAQRRAHFGPRLVHALGAAWPWSLVASLGVRLLLMPGTVLLDYVAGVEIPTLVMILLPFAAFGLTVLTLVTAGAHDVARQLDARAAAAMSAPASLR